MTVRLTYTFRLAEIPAIGFIKASSLQEALDEAVFLWQRAHHKRKDGAWFNILGGCIVTLPDGGTCQPWARDP
jgi:hypothetical protein